MGRSAHLGVVLLHILFINVLGGAESCTNPFTAIGDQCIYFGNDVQLNQWDAKDFCISIGGQLMQIKNAHQFQDLVQYLNSNASDAKVSYYVDGSDTMKEGMWMDSSGEIVPHGTPFWATWTTFQGRVGQFPKVDESRNCIGLGRDVFLYLRDISCEDTRSPICVELEGTKIPREPLERCDGLPDLTDSTGTIYSPSWPSTYPSHTQCYWRINIPDDGNYIRLSFASFDTDVDDILEIYEGESLYFDQIGEYSGRHRLIPDIPSKGTWLSLSFFSDGDEEYDGFEIHWRSEQANSSCIEAYSSSEGQLFSPGFPAQYAQNLNCQYTITTDQDKIIKLTTAFFETDGPGDYLNIYDGGDSNAPLLMTLSGTQHNVPDISSTGNQLFITFQTDEAFAAAGFDMAWKTELACPLPFISIGSMCLKFLFSDLTFGQAAVSCVTDGGSLAAIHTAEQLREFFLYVHQHGIAKSDYWLGGSDSESEGIWTWEDGSSVAMGTPFWGTVDTNAETQEPDGITQENCLVLTSQGYFYFRDQDCSIQHKAICMYQK